MKRIRVHRMVAVALGLLVVGLVAVQPVVGVSQRLLSTSSLSQSQGLQPNTYVDPDYAFSFSYPAEWFAYETTVAGCEKAIYLVSPSKDSDITVMIGQGPVFTGSLFDNPSSRATPQGHMIRIVDIPAGQNPAQRVAWISKGTMTFTFQLVYTHGSSLRVLEQLLDSFSMMPLAQARVEATYIAAVDAS